MNIALPRTRTGHKAPHLAALIAALSTLAVVASVGIWQLAGSGDVAPLPASRFSTFQIAPSQTSLFVYVVDSDEKADLINASLARAENERASTDEPYYEDNRFVVIKATSPDEEQDVNEIVAAWISGGASVHLLDVRGR